MNISKAQYKVTGKMPLMKIFDFAIGDTYTADFTDRVIAGEYERIHFNDYPAIFQPVVDEYGTPTPLSQSGEDRNEKCICDNFPEDNIGGYAGCPVHDPNYAPPHFPVKTTTQNLFDLLANKGGHVVSTAALTTDEIDTARKKNRLFVEVSGLGFVWQPESIQEVKQKERLSQLTFLTSKKRAYNKPSTPTVKESGEDIRKDHELFRVQSEYIKLLEKECGNLLGIAHVHGYRASDEDVKKGIELRDKINELQSLSTLPASNKEQQVIKCHCTGSGTMRACKQNCDKVDGRKLLQSLATSPDEQWIDSCKETLLNALDAFEYDYSFKDGKIDPETVHLLRAVTTRLKYGNPPKEREGIDKEEETEYMLQVRHGVEWYDCQNQKEGRDPEGIYRKVPIVKDNTVTEEKKEQLFLRLCYDNLDKFNDVSKVDPPKDKKITVFCKGADNEGFAIDIFWKDLGLEELISKKWILHEEITKYAVPQETSTIPIVDYESDKWLAELFDNNSNCYADSPDVVLAITQDVFIKLVRQMSVDRIMAGEIWDAALRWISQCEAVLKHGGRPTTTDKATLLSPLPVGVDEPLMGELVNKIIIDGLNVTELNELYIVNRK